ncbi:MAG: RNA polymerase sigma factor [Marinoscillum sp.]
MEDHLIISKIQDIETRHYGFNLLIKAYQERIYWHIRKMVVIHEDADDLTQIVFVKVWKNLDNFRADSTLYTWIYRIATNECLSFLRKQKTRHFLSLSSLNDTLTEHLTSSHQVSGDEVQLKLQKALLKLPDKQRLVFNMKYFDDLKFEEIADITNTSVGALKASYHHAVKKIENFITED